jgi:hypothetical protein
MEPPKFHIVRDPTTGKFVPASDGYVKILTLIIYPSEIKLNYQSKSKVMLFICSKYTPFSSK